MYYIVIIQSAEKGYWIYKTPAESDIEAMWNAAEHWHYDTYGRPLPLKREKGVSPAGWFAGMKDMQIHAHRLADIVHVLPVSKI